MVVNSEFQTVVIGDGRVEPQLQSVCLDVDLNPFSVVATPMVSDFDSARLLRNESFQLHLSDSCVGKLFQDAAPIFLKRNLR